MRVTLIVAAALNNVIGRNGALPWRISDDLRCFRALTWGKPIVMGRKTYESIGAPLPGRTSIVVSRSAWSAPGTVGARSLEEALGLAGEVGAEAMVIGGAAIFEAAMPAAARIHLTRVLAEVDGDVRFPPVDPAQWRKTSVGATQKSRRNDYSCRYFILDRL